MRLTPLRPLVLGLALAGVGLAACTPIERVRTPVAEAPAAPAVDIPFETFTLPNGLRVVVHTDRKAPVVAVNVWYHVGSKDEPPGKTGFAHLFEHLMFQGSENYRDEFFGPFEQVGATNQNGTTSTDRTNYFQNVPTTALDMALWMESDRMGHFLGAIDQSLLDEQRGVVQNEKRQGENQPYGLAWDRLARASYPAGHPYSWSVIGSMADLNAANLDDVRTFFRTWYGPNNAVLVLAGDIDLETAREKATLYFGDIAPGPVTTQPPVDVAKRELSTRELKADRVPQVRIYRSWNVAEFGTADADHLALLAQVLGGSRSSRLDRRLVHEEALVDSVSSFSMSAQLGGRFMVIANVKREVDPVKVEAVLDEEFARLLAEGITAEELEQARTVFQARFIRGIERVGGFGGKSDILAQCTTFTGDPGCFRSSMARVESAQPRDLLAVAQRWLASGDHTLVIEPGQRPEPEPDVRSLDEGETDLALADPLPAPGLSALPSGVDRSSGVPQTTEFPRLVFPALERARLSNGVEVVLAQRHDVPVVQLSLELRGGYRLDLGRTLGTASFTMEMLDEGAGELRALDFGARVESLGALIGAGASLDGANVYLSSLLENLDPSLGLWADAILRPRFDEADIERVRASWIAGIRQEKSRPNSIGWRILPPVLYGQGHPYAIPFSGSGTEASIAALSREDLVAFHRDQLHPAKATIVAVGAIDLATLLPLLEKHLGAWAGAADAVEIAALPQVALPAAQRVFLVDQPGATQANILAGQLVMPTPADNAMAFDMANGVLGGTFTSRLNMNLREDKGWSYGSSSGASGALGQRPWIASAPVQIDRTVDAVAELKREFRDFLGSRPAQPDELEKIRARNVRTLPGSFESASAVLNQIGGILRFNRPDDWPLRFQALQEAMTLEQVHAAATALQPDQLTWVIVGDLSQIEAPVRAQFGPEVEVAVLDADGQPVQR
ncbi:MAG: insulinase family protein [Aquimonas sp.]|nr:insulinase family protein [Aquimonas sp.]